MVEGWWRCEEYFEKFQRLPSETLTEYEMRKRDLRERLKGAGIMIPDEVAVQPHGGRGGGCAPLH